MDLTKKNVLIFPAGSEIGIEIFNSLKYNHHFELFGASGKSDHASYMYQENYYFESDLFIDDVKFVDRFNELLTRWNIKFVIPTHDSISYFLATVRHKINAEIVTSSEQANEIARFKNITYDVFKKYDFCPQVFNFTQKLNYPVYLKPTDSQGGKGNSLIRNEVELSNYTELADSSVLCEFLPGKEYSVDCFTDFNGDLVFIGPRTRERVKIGISFRSESVPLTENINYIANIINSELQPNGAWFFQIKKDVNDRWKLLEVATRQASTMGLYRANGVNFALLSLFNAQGISVSIINNKHNVSLDRYLGNRFKVKVEYNKIYIDLDETLIADGMVNPQIMAYLYQEKNAGKSIILITKHRYNLSQTLNELAISKYLFNEIIHLSNSEDKVDFIKPDNAIFIDNYFPDRLNVSEKLKIPVFDVDAVECLIK
ncbi:ATP-grasp domain-containing protein [uncultured Psychrosphaera sp.]|uniref:ATP-grasp domain-containing protein n=1 Tax=uncultured Psychrosphaera sp. TaxID=1403522 RepID=UPI002634F4C8|nr:ATP-grasp domain-containing protein [uncultured Psychrosphaera sp.]